MTPSRDAEGVSPDASKPELEAGFDAVFLESLRPVVMGVAALYLVFAVADVFVMPAPLNAIQAFMEAALALGLMGLWYALGRWSLPAQWSHAVGGVVCFAILGDTLVPLFLLEDPNQTIYLVLLQLGAGLFFLSWRWLLSVLLGCDAGWMLAVAASPQDPAWVTFGLALLASTVLAILAVAVRRRVYARLEGLRLADGRRAQQLEQAALDARRSQERFRRLADATSEGILVHDGQRILDANERFAALVGLPLEDIGGRDVMGFVATASRDLVLRNQRMEAPAAYEATCVRVDGTTFPAEILERSLPFEGRTVRVAAVRDLTEQKRAEESQRVLLERALEIERLKEVDRFKTQLLNTAGHELNTPLTALKLQLHLLKTQPSPAPTSHPQRMVDLADRNVDRLTRLVQDMLDVARLESGRLVLQRGPVDLHEVAAEVVESLRVLAQAKSVTLRLESDEHLWADADPLRVGQVLVNLVGNGIKFTPTGGRVEVAAHRIGTELLVTVHDSGVGIRAEDIPQLFEPFVQLHEATADVPQGSGLGLFISRGIVEQHGGRIWCQSDGPDLGATFAFSIPALVTSRNL